MIDENGGSGACVIDEIHDFGGMTQFVESGLPKLQIEESAIRRQASIDRKEW